MTLLGNLSARLSRLSLRSKFALPIGILVIAIIMGFGIGLFVKGRTDQFLDEMQALHLPRLELATEARNNFATAKLHAVQYFLDLSPAQKAIDLRALREGMDAVDEGIGKFIELGGARHVLEYAGEVRRTLIEARKIDPVAGSTAAGASAGDLADIYFARADVSPALETLLARVREEMSLAREEAEVIRRRTVRSIGILGVLALAASLLTLSWLVRTQLAAPLQRLHARMIEIAARPVEALAAEPGQSDDPSLSAPVPDLDRGDELGAMASAVDLLRQDTALAVLLMRRLQTARQELVDQAKMVSLGATVAGVAHEINTPIGICVTGSSGMIEEIEDLIEAQKSGALSPAQLNGALRRLNDYAALVLSNMTRAGSLVGSFKQISVDQTADVVREFELGVYVRQILDTLGPELSKAKVTAEMDCPEPIQVAKRPSVIWQILSNLILNALRHAFPNGAAPKRPPEVRIALQRIPGQIRIDVADNGVGIPEEARGQIFDPFFTTRRREGGSGLGLAIVYNLVTRSLMGTIECVSMPGEGARFVIMIPDVQAKP